MHFYRDTGKAISLGAILLLFQAFEGASLGADAPRVAGYERLKQSDQSTAEQRGELLLGELNCTSCHQAKGLINDRIWPRTAPDLTSVGARLTPHYLRSYL